MGEEDVDDAGEPVEEMAPAQDDAGGAPLDQDEQPEDTVETAEDREFIDDAGVQPEEQYGSDNEQAGYHEEAEELVPDELDAIFAKGKKKKIQR